MDQPSKEADERIRTHVMQDLDPGVMTVLTKVGTAAAVGGLLSLLICGQFGVGISSLAEAFSATVHDSMGPLPCALICGTLYAVFPVAILRLLLCSPLQFKVIIHRRWSVVVLWLGGFGGVMAYFGHHGGDILTLSAWVIAALAATNIFARLFELVIPAWSLAESQLLDP